MNRLINYLVYSIIICILIKSSVAQVVSPFISGSRQPCTNEGEEVLIDINDNKCFKCICKNGFVECISKACQPIDECYFKQKRQSGDCCERCLDCHFNNMTYSSGSEWTDPQDPCTHYKCVAGIITQSNLQCYPSCDEPPKPGQCCPTCLGCKLNGKLVQEGREVTLSEDSCMKCKCTNRRLTCMKKACPVIDCPKSLQRKRPGECCPRCIKKRDVIENPKFLDYCFIGNQQYANGQRFSIEHCAECICRNGTSFCKRNTCPVLECAKDSQIQRPGDCCPQCPIIMEAQSSCIYNGKSYQNNETWDIDACTSCRCNNGNMICMKNECPKLKCLPTETLVKSPGQCCDKCVEANGVCTVFGDPHYKTFDGKFYSFQGLCKYLLTADCTDAKNFSIRITNEDRGVKKSSWIKTVTLRFMDVKVNLGQKMRVKINGSRIKLPFTIPNRVNVKESENGVIVDTSIGIQLLWNGNSFLQVQVPPTYKNKLCGLCGNYNEKSSDDLKLRIGTVLNDTKIHAFASSWRVGGQKKCLQQNKRKFKGCKSEEPNTNCKHLNESADKQTVFGNCHSKLYSMNYYKSCNSDMCSCPYKMCYCDSYLAYAIECEKLGVNMTNWRRETKCELHRIQRAQEKYRKELAMLQNSTRPYDRTLASIRPSHHRNQKHNKQRKMKNYQPELDEELNIYLPPKFRHNKNISGRKPLPIH